MLRMTAPFAQGSHGWWLFLLPLFAQGSLEGGHKGALKKGQSIFRADELFFGRQAADDGKQPRRKFVLFMTFFRRP